MAEILYNSISVFFLKNTSPVGSGNEKREHNEQKFQKVFKTHYFVIAYLFENLNYNSIRGKL